jgi:hypothetical protein
MNCRAIQSRRPTATTKMPSAAPRTLALHNWQARADAQRQRAARWTVPYRERRARGTMHPIYDFLFLYYRFAPTQLEHWHPGPGVTLEAPSDGATWLSDKFYSHTADGLTLDTAKLDRKARTRLQWHLGLCRSIQQRPTQFKCFGLHEWAMVYRGGPDGRARHEGTLPMRLPQAQIDAVVESRAICCSHFDAFRFFTDSARSFNRLQPTQDRRIDNEQAGCLHTNMDLYKWASKSMPWIGSELLWDCFEFALHCRELDMRASPYDCRSLGYEPIPIETEAGRAHYEREQRALSAAAQPLRARLIDALQSLLDASA